MTPWTHAVAWYAEQKGQHMATWTATHPQPWPEANCVDCGAHYRLALGQSVCALCPDCCKLVKAETAYRLAGALVAHLRSQAKTRKENAGRDSICLAPSK